MKIHPSPGWLGFFEAALLATALTVSDLQAQDNSPAVAKPAVNAGVTVTDNGRTWTLDNGIVKAVVDKRNAAMNSLFFGGIDTMGHDQGQSGYWEQDPSAAAAVGSLTDTVTIDPAKNGGERGEVAVKGVTGGQTQLSAGAPGGGTYCDMEVRYALGRGDSGVYVYAIFSHPTARGAWDRRAVTSPRSTRTSIGFPWTRIATCSNARRRTGAPAWWSTRRSSGS
jgi:rhamnogalacturonan endolyase